MSFFGLTAFGPENFIQSSKVDSNGFTLFSEEDFKLGFDKVCKFKNKSFINISDVKNFLHYTFNFAPLDEEVKVFVENSGKLVENDILLWEDILQTLERIKIILQDESKKSLKYTSHKKYYDDTYKHKRKEASPTEVFKMPVTYGQNYGFHKFMIRNLNEIKYPKVKCDETKYAESMIMTGKQFMK